MESGLRTGQHLKLSFDRRLEREIDRETMLDILALLEYEQARLELLELEFGYGIGSDSVMCFLFEYVLDALHWPANNAFREQAYEVFFTEPPLERADLHERLNQLQDCRQHS